MRQLKRRLDMNNGIKILFICHGNICRSPMAEYIFKKMLEDQGLTSEFYVASAATSSEEIYNGVGNPVYPPAKRELAKHGISCSEKRAVQITRDDYERYDLLIGMDEANIRNMKRVFGGDAKGKIHMLLEYAGIERGIADPWYSGNFVVTYNDIVTGCEALLRYMRENDLI